MPIVSFEVKNSDGFPFLLEAHGTVQREGFGDPYHIEIDSFYISFDGEEGLESDDKRIH